ncbi:MAG: 6-carboxytetrahydropterin synthase [Bacteroidales bacterium]|nr:6-carboxytetrahydropterin synthase [Bacteroidales bacterium]MCF8389664.1 6-carboxytetrahydropterin synthase [Bacteroidales bacterium]
MTKIRVTKEFDFEMAHALKNYDGLCRNIHGHSYHLSVCIIGEVLEDETNPKNGMVADFGDIKKMVNTHIVKKLDHSLILPGSEAEQGIDTQNPMFGRLIMVNFQPSCENLLIYISGELKKVLPAHLSLHSLILRETGNSYAEWFASDNP